MMPDRHRPARGGPGETEATGPALSDFAGRVLDVAEAIPPGRVMSYGDLAEYLGEGGPLRVTSSTFSPWWSVSGEELLRGYEATYPGVKLDGVIGLDLQALADVFRVTGPVDLPHFGSITADTCRPSSCMM